MPARTGDQGRVTAWVEIFLRFLRLGLTSFGGPVAHLGYFRREFVERARWLDDATFAEIVAICSALPGPSSSQVGITIGWRRAGIAGALLAWLAFSAPSALALAAFGLALREARIGDAGIRGSVVLAGALDALAGAAAAVVFIAVVQLWRSLVTTSLARTIASCAFALALGIDRWMPSLQWTILLFGGAAGARFGAVRTLPPAPPPVRISRHAGVVASVALVVLLASLPFFARAGGYVALAATFFRAGSLVFGGGHVVLPFLQSLIGIGRIDTATFYGATEPRRPCPARSLRLQHFSAPSMQPCRTAFSERSSRCRQSSHRRSCSSRRRYRCGASCARFRAPAPHSRESTRRSWGYSPQYSSTRLRSPSPAIQSVS